MFRSERKIMKILAIESSCDETAAAVVEDGRNIISSVVASQVEEHKLYGGVVPEIASRRHAEAGLFTQLPAHDAACHLLFPPLPGKKKTFCLTIARLPFRVTVWTTTCLLYPLSDTTRVG